MLENKKQESLRIGLVQFKDNITQDFIKQLKQSQYFWMLQRNYWEFPVHSQHQGVQLFFKYTKKAQIKGIIIQFFMQGTKICNLAASIQFSKLTELILLQINLSNIQFIEFLDCPNLEDLCLALNNITNIKPLNKLKLKYLDKVSIYYNKLNVNSLNRIFINQQNKFYFQTRCYRYEKSYKNKNPNGYTIQDLAVYMKLQANTLYHDLQTDLHNIQQGTPQIFYNIRQQKKLFKFVDKFKFTSSSEKLNRKIMRLKIKEGLQIYHNQQNQ